MDISIYDFEDNLHSSQLVEYSKEPIMYDFRKISNQVKKLGRPLTNEEAEKYKVKKWGEFEFEMENKKLERFCSVKLKIFLGRKEFNMKNTNVNISATKEHANLYVDIIKKDIHNLLKCEFMDYHNTIISDGANGIYSKLTTIENYLDEYLKLINRMKESDFEDTITLERNVE